MLKYLITLSLLVIMLHPQTVNLRSAPLLSSLKIIKPPIVIGELLPRADAYFGTVDVNIQDGESKHMDYFVYFVQDNNSCNYQKCYNGWVANYTVDDVTVQGYPDGASPKPVFSYSVNSQTDFLIVRDPQLPSQFVDIIEISCHQFNPTISAPPPPKPILAASNLKLSASSASAFIGQSASAFIGQSANIKATPSEFTFNFLPKIGFQGIKTATLKQDLRVNNLETEFATLNRQVEINSNLQINNRLDSVDIKLASDYLQKTEDDGNSSDNSYNFVGNVGVKLQKKSSLYLDVSALQSQINKFSKNKANFFSKSSIEARRVNIDQVKFKSSDFKAEDTISEDPEVVTTAEVQSEFDLQGEVQKASLVKTVLPADSRINTDSLINPADNQATSSDSSILLTQNLISKSLISNIGSNPARLLPSTLIFTYSKVLYSKTILGKTFSVSVQVTGYQIDTYTVRLIGTLYYNIFGNTKSVAIFDITRQAGFNWGITKNFSGKWSFNIYIPLPPPVSFIGINFQVSLTYYIGVQLFANGHWSTQINGYAFQAGAIANTGLYADAAASLRVIAIEGGVYIAGTLVNLTTDPTLALNFMISQNLLQIKLTWFFYINAFNMEWGFFWRYWRFWAGWSSRKIIAKWNIKGIYAKYNVYSFNRYQQLY